MTHLTPQEQIDLLDGALAPERRAHAEACAVCQREAAELGALAGGVRAAGEVPEPSPLFWDHFSRRVEAATREVPEPAWWHGLWRPLLAASAAAAAMTFVLVTRPPARSPATPAPARASASATTAGPSVEPLADQEDGSLAVVAVAAQGLSWDEARDTNLIPPRVVVDTAIDELNEAQRAELVRLIHEEMGGLE